MHREKATSLWWLIVRLRRLQDGAAVLFILKEILMSANIHSCPHRVFDGKIAGGIEVSSPET